MTSQGVENTCVDCRRSFSCVKIIETPLGGIWATSSALLLFLLHVFPDRARVFIYSPMYGFVVSSFLPVLDSSSAHRSVVSFRVGVNSIVKIFCL